MTEFLASLSFYILPFVIGYALFRNVLLSFPIGALILYGFFGILSFLINIFGLTNFYQSILAFSITNLFFISLLVVYIRMIKKNYSFNAFQSVKSLLPFVLLLTISCFVYFGIWKNDSPYPFQLNWDIYEHITISNQIVNKDFSVLPSHLSDTFTFDGYTTLFHTLLSIPRLIFNANVLGTYWYLEYWHFFLSGVVTFLLTKQFIRNTAFALFAGASSFLFFESSIAYTSLFLIPQTMSALFGILILLYVFQHHQTIFQRQRFIPLIVASTAVMSMHFIIGAFLLSIIGATIVFLRKTSLIKYGLIASIILLIASFLGHIFGNITLTGREEAYYFSLGFSQKMELLVDWYGIGTAFLFLAGILFALKKGTLNQKLLLSLVFGSLAVALAPISYFLKYYVISHYFVVPILMLGLMAFFKKLPKVAVVGLGIWLLISFSITFYLNQSNYKKILFYQNNYGHFSNQELEAANYLAKNYNQQTLIISDPSTQYILEAISGVNSQGGAYMNESTRKILSDLKFESDPNLIKSELDKINDQLLKTSKQTQRRLFVVGGRYYEWQNFPDEEKKSFYYNVWRPSAIGNFDHRRIEKLMTEFKLVFKNDEIAIFEI